MSWLVHKVSHGAVARRVHGSARDHGAEEAGLNRRTAWDAETYLAVDRMLFDVDGVLRRMIGWSSRPRVPAETDEALARAWSLGIDMAQILLEEKQRLIQAKIDHDLAA